MTVTITNGMLQANVASLKTNINSLTKVLSNGPRIVPRALREVYAAADSIPAEIVGYGGVHASNPSGTTGGQGYSIYYVNNPSITDTADPYSIISAINSCIAAGGGIIIFEPIGQYDIVLPDRMVLGTEFSNVTIWAPGRNVVFWSDRLKGILNISGSNLIFKNIQFRPLAGPINGTAVSEITPQAKTLVQVQADSSNRLAFLGCEFRHPSWHCLDITRATPTVDGHQCFFSVQNCIFLDAIQAHLIGTNQGQFAANGYAYTDDNSTRYTFGTFYETIWAYNLMRNPKVLGAAQVDMVNCYTVLRPYATEYNDWAGHAPYNDIETGAWGAAVQEGGWLSVRGSLFQSAHTMVDGVKATFLSVAPTISNNSGRISVQGSAAENNLYFETRDANLITAAPYNLPHTPVPAAGQKRDDWVKSLWAKAGARLDSAPNGTFVSIKSTGDNTAPIPNGETIILENRTDRSTLLVRVDPLREYSAPAATVTDKLEAQVRSTTRYVGKDEGRSTGTAIDPNILDLTSLTSTYFAVVANTAVNLYDIVAKSESVVTDGLTLHVYGLSTTPVTLKNAKTSIVTVNAASDTITYTGHGRSASGFNVRVTSTNAVPTGLSNAVRYYGVYVDANNFKLAPTYADAIGNTNIVDFTDSGNGTISTTVGSFSLPGGIDMTLRSTSEVLTLRYNTGILRFHPEIGLPGDSGNAAPTLTGLTNVSANSVTAHKYSRPAGANVVQGMLRTTVTPTTNNTATTLNFSLPVTSNLTVNSDVTGIATCVTSGASLNVPVTANTSADVGTFTFTPITGTAALDFVISYAYDVK